MKNRSVEKSNLLKRKQYQRFAVSVMKQCNGGGIKEVKI